jgi:Rhodopirellula transposase.
MDTKASVDVGEYSRYGRSRCLEPVKALDHDMRPKEKLVPGGILEIVSGRSFLFFTSSYKTSDFMVDGLLLWWNERKHELPDLKCYRRQHGQRSGMQWASKSIFEKDG